MAERIISYSSPDSMSFTQKLAGATDTHQLGNGQELLIPHLPLILPSESHEAVLSHSYEDRSSPEYPYYVNHEGFIVGPHKVGKHAWIVGRQENKPGTIPLNANSVLVGNILIDPGSTEGIPYLLENLKERGSGLDQIELVLLTHAHLDHMEAIYDLQMLGLVAPVFVPQKSVEVISHADVKKIGMDMYKHDFTPFRIDHELLDNEIIEASGFKIRTVEGPGHSEDSMYYVLTDPDGHNTFVVGDILVGGARKEFGVHKGDWKRTLSELMNEVREADDKNISESDDDIVCGHYARGLHKTNLLMREVSKFGKQKFDLIPSQPGMMQSYWG